MSTGVFLPSFHHSCIIEEQEDHLVLAIRVPRATIAANMALFAALADRTGALSEPFHARPPIRTRLKAWHTKAILGAAVLFIGMFGAPSLTPTSGYASASPPVEYRNWKISKPVFAIGEPIEIDVQYRRDRQCPTVIDRSIMRVDYSESVYSKREITAGQLQSSKEFVDRRVVLNADLKPGEYVYSGTLYSDCSDGSYITPHDRVTFRVE